MVFDLAKELNELPLEQDASTFRVRELCEKAAAAERDFWIAAMEKEGNAKIAASKKAALRDAAAAMRKVLTPESMDSLIVALLEGLDRT